MTRKQVAAYAADHPALEITPDGLLAGTVTSEEAMSWVDGLSSGATPLIYSSAEPAAVKSAQECHGRDRVAAAIEGFFAETARRLVARGIGASSLPAAKRRVRWSRGSAFWRSPSGRRSRPAYRRSRHRTGPFGWRSSPATSVPRSFFVDALTVLAGARP